MDLTADAPRVAVLGAGAMGALYGAELASAAIPTVLVDVDEELVATIEGRGVLVRDGADERRVRVPAVCDPTGCEPVDLVLVFVKAFATDAAARLVAPLTTPATVAVSLQNGWGSGRVLGQHFDPDRVVVGVSYQSATVEAPGVVRRTASGPTVLGPSDAGGDAAAQRAAAILRAAGFETEVRSDIERVIWDKLVVNAAANPTAALTGLSAGALRRSGAMSDLIDGLAREAVVVANGLGHDLDADASVAHVLEVLEAAADGKGSMLQDVLARRRTEIDVITGAIVRAADEIGVAVPLNRTIYALVRGYEDSLEGDRAGAAA